MTPERFAIGDGPVRTLYPGTREGERMAAERNAALISRIAEPHDPRSPASHIGHIPRLRAARDGSTGHCTRVLDPQTGDRCGVPFQFAGAPNRTYCDEHSAGVQKRGRG